MSSIETRHDLGDRHLLSPRENEPVNPFPGTPIGWKMDSQRSPLGMLAAQDSRTETRRLGPAG